MRQGFSAHNDGAGVSRLLATTLLGVLLLVLSACQPAGTRPVIKIGLMAPFTGADEAVGYSVVGVVREAIRQRNLAGGVSGYSVELVALDDSNLPEAAAQRALEMIIDPAVMAVLGGFDGETTVAAFAEYERAAMPFVTLASTDRLVGGAGRPIWRLAATDSYVGTHAARFATDTLGARRITVIGEALPGSDPLGDSFSSAAQAGGAMVSRVTMERWQLDFGGAIRRLAEASPDLVFFAGRAIEAGELLGQMRAAGVQATFLGGPGVDDARLLQIAGPGARGAYYVSGGLPVSEVSDPVLQKTLIASSLRSPGAYTALAYDGTQVVLDALERAIRQDGKPARSSVGRALGATLYQGATGEIGFDEHGNRRNPPLGLYRIESAYPGLNVR